MARNRKTSFDATAMINSLMRDDANDDHALGITVPGSGSRSQDGSSVVTKTSGASSGVQLAAPVSGSSAMDHLDALGDDAAQKSENEGGTGVDDHSGSGATLASSNQRLLLEALMGVTGSTTSGSNQRDRLESWGGMSDLSVAGIGETSSLGKGGAHAAAAIAASALHHTGLIDDVTAAAAAIDLPSVNLGSVSNSCAGSVASSASGVVDPHTKVPTRISLTSDRKYSLASLSDASAPSHATENKDISTDIHAYVAAAMATVGEQLKDLAGAVQSAASSTGSVASEAAKSADSESLETSSLSQAVTKATVDAKASKEVKETAGRPRSLSTSSNSKPISVDFDAVAAAVNAAEAATGAIDLASIASMTPPMSRPGSSPAGKQKKKNHRLLPLNRKGPVDASPTSTTCSKPSTRPAGPAHYPPVPQSSVSPRDMEAIRARARAAAGYIPPSADSLANGNKRGASTHSARPPLKKRAKRQSPEPDRVSSLSATSRKSLVAPPSKYATLGQGANIAQNIKPPRFPKSPNPNASSYSHGSAVAATPKGQSNQKWDDMYECLLKFVKERRETELKGATEKEKKAWEWDGNVPTTYKTSDGKALGRWINNQRSAKHKGALREEREARLVSTGLKWSVLSTNSWSDMLNELKLYVKEKTKDGEKWDGNVPTNYRIKGANGADKTEDDEEKNLGRWINRQRSLYQSGKLKKDRQLVLSQLGLRWKVLSTTSWESMYESLQQYANDKKKADPNNEWDGNVPANHKTEDTPPKSLGRWVNRQRSAYAKKKLKQEFVDKLNQLGLRWAVHEKRASALGNKEEAAENGGTEKSTAKAEVDENNGNRTNNDKENSGRCEETAK